MEYNVLSKKHTQTFKKNCRVKSLFYILLNWKLQGESNCVCFIKVNKMSFVKEICCILSSCSCEYKQPFILRPASNN